MDTLKVKTCYDGNMRVEHQRTTPSGAYFLGGHMKEQDDFMRLLKNYKHTLTRQQYRTLKGQYLSGNEEGARKGFLRLTRKRCTKCQ